MFNVVVGVAIAMVNALASRMCTKAAESRPRSCRCLVHCKQIWRCCAHFLLFNEFPCLACGWARPRFSGREATTGTCGGYSCMQCDRSGHDARALCMSIVRVWQHRAQHSMRCVENVCNSRSRMHCCRCAHVAASLQAI